MADGGRQASLDPRVSFVTMNPMLNRSSATIDGPARSSALPGLNNLDDLLYGDASERKDQNRNGVSDLRSLIYDSVPVNFDMNVFLRQVFINLVPFVALLFQPCLTEDLATYGFSPSLLFGGKEKRQYFIMNQLPPLCVVLSVVLYNAMPEETEPGWPEGKRSGLFGGNVIVPCVVYMLHRLTVCFKYATLHPSEYHRFNSATFDQALVYQAQLQLLSSWHKERAMQIHTYLIKAAECIADVNLSPLHIKIANPKLNNVNKYRFIQWQAYMKGTCDLSIFNEELDSALKHRILPDPSGSGDYLITAVQLMETIMATVDEGKLFVSKSYENVARVDIMLVMGYPIIRMIVNLLTPHAAAALTPREWVIVFTEFFCTSLILNYLKNSISSFFITLLNDSERRLSEAEVLKEMVRTSEVVFESDTVHLGRSPLNRRGVENYSKVLVDVANPLGINGHPEVVLFADKVVDEQLYQDEVCAQQRNADVDAHVAAYQEGDWQDGEDFGDHATQVHHPARYMGRTPQIDIQHSGKTNVVAWLAMRDTFRNMGTRYKFRIDFFAVLLTLSNFTTLLIIIGTHLVAQHAASSQGDDNFQKNNKVVPLVCFDSSFSVQTMTTTLFFVYALLGNVAAAVRTNEKFESHQYVLHNAVMAIEKEYSLERENLEDSIPAPVMSTNSSLDDLIEAVEAEERREKDTPREGEGVSVKERLKMMKEGLDSLGVALMSVRVTDDAVPVTILGIPATWTLYLTLVTALLSVAASLTSAFSNVDTQL